MIGPYIKAGVSTEYLDDICNDYIVNTLQAFLPMWVITVLPKRPVFPSMKKYAMPFPLPKRFWRDGDILNIDVAVIKDGYFGDTSRMYFVGTPSPEAKKIS